MTRTLSLYGPDATVGEVREALSGLRDDDPLTFMVIDGDEERFGSFALIEVVEPGPAGEPTPSSRSGPEGRCRTPSRP